MSKNISCSCFSRFVIAIFLSVFSFTSSFSQGDKPADDPAVAKGQQLFKENCSSCHEVFAKKVGPALKGVTKRWADKGLLVKFIRNSDKVKATGDAYVTKLTAEYQGMAMPQHEFLSEDDVKAILTYVEKAPEPAKATKGPETGGPITPWEKEDNSSFILTLILVVLVLVVIALSLVLIFVKKYLKDKEANLSEDEKYLVDQKFEVGTFLKSKGFIGVVVFIFVCVATRVIWMGMMAVGVEQNYEPKQPIPFSHKIHAGQYKINCNYCHTGVTKGKQAGIPSINICMNCHSQIQEGAVNGKAGIAILLDSYKNKKPIQWVRVHNLPDLAYFNHSQHVKAGGVECSTCHGPIDSMEVVRQYSPLTMGWCINCHRKTDIKLKDNAYYQKFLDKHNSMTVEQIGGLECSKCHY